MSTTCIEYSSGKCAATLDGDCFAYFRPFPMFLAFGECRVAQRLVWNLLSLPMIVVYSCNLVCCCAPAMSMCAFYKIVGEMERNVLEGNINSEDHHSLDWVYSHLDKNGDGQVSKAEFMELAPTVLNEALFSGPKPGQDVPSQMSMSANKI